MEYLSSRYPVRYKLLTEDLYLEKLSKPLVRHSINISPLPTLGQGTLKKKKLQSPKSPERRHCSVESRGVCSTECYMPYGYRSIDVEAMTGQGT